MAIGRANISETAFEYGGPPASGGLELRLAGTRDAAARARRALARVDGSLEESRRNDLRLLVTELVTNSVRHARADEVDVQAVATGASVWVEVTDRGPGFDPDENPGPNGTSGWGLFLVERLADRWGVSREGSTTRVWFQLQRA